MLRSRVASGLAVPMVLGLLAGALAASPAAAPRFEQYYPETRVGKSRLPEARVPEGVPFAPSEDSVDASLERQGSKLWLKARARSSHTLKVSVHRARFPSPATLRAAFRSSAEFPLSTEPEGEALVTRELQAREDLARRWHDAFFALRRDPAGLLQPYVVQNAANQAQDWISWGYRGDAVPRFEEKVGDAVHVLENSLNGNWYTYRQDDALNPRGYGSDQDGWRPRAWVALRPAYEMQLATEVELPGPGAYVVVARSEGNVSYAPFLMTDLESVVRRDGDEVFLQAVQREDGEATRGVSGRVYWLTGLGDGKYRVADEELALGPTGAGTMTVPEGTSESWVVLEKGPHRNLVSGAGFQDAARARTKGRTDLAWAQGGGFVHLTTDRPVYKPGEVVHFRGVARKLREGIDFGVLANRTGTIQLGWGDGPRAEVRTDSLGAFHGDLPLAKDQRTGSFYLQANVDGASGNLTVQVDAYRKPEHEVLVRPLEDWTAQGDTATVELHGRFTVGGDLQGSKVRWTARSVYASQAPFEGQLRSWCMGPGWSWRLQEGGSGWYQKDGEGKLDDRGHLRVPLELTKAPNDYSVRVEATVISPDGREVHGAGTFYAPRAALVVAMRSTMGLVEEGEAWRVRGALRDMEGKPVSGPVRLKLERHVWENSGGTGVQHRLEELRTWTEQVPAGGEADWEIPLARAGETQLTATASDGRGRETSAMVHTYRFGADAPWYNGDGLEATADQEAYAPGETATVLVRLPLAQGTLWWSLEGERFRRRGAVAFRGFNALVKVPLGAEDRPEAKLHLEALKDGRRIQRDVNLEVPARERMAEFSLTTDARVYQPGGPVRVSLELKDEAGRPLVGDVCLAVYDEALLQVAPDRTPDPYEHFYGSRHNRVQQFETWRSSYELTNRRKSSSRDEEKSGGRAMARQSMSLLAAPAPPGAESEPDEAGERRADSSTEASAGEPPGIKIRSDFRDLAHWVGSVRTDARGRAGVDFQLPDDLARWRLVAYAVDAETRVGKAVSRVIARKDLMVRLGLPRFLTTGDHILVKSSVQNMGDQPAPGKLDFETLGARPVPLGEKDLETLNVRLDPAGGWLVSRDGPVPRAPDLYELTVPAHGHAAVDFPIYVFDYPDSGEMSFQSVFDSRGKGDGLKRSIPVVPFGRRQTEVTVHELKDRARLEVPRRPGSFENATEVALDLMLNLEQAARTALLDDVKQLIDYAYGCTEQTLSRFVPLAIAEATLGEPWLRASGVETALPPLVEKGVERLKQLRRGDGWGWAPGGEASSSTTAYLISRLARLPEPHKAALWKSLDIPRALSWLARLYEAHGQQALDREEREHELYRMLGVYRAFEALSVAGVKLDLPRLPERDDLLKSPRFWAAYGTGALHQGRKDQAEKAAARLAALSLGNGAFHYWQHQGAGWSWYGDDAETVALVLEFLADLGGEQAKQAEAFRGGLRWLVQGEGMGRYRSTKARAVAVAVAARYLQDKQASASRQGARVTVRAGGEQRAEVPADPRARRQRVFVDAPALNRAKGVIELEKQGGADVFVRQDTTYFYRGPFEPEDHGFRVRSRLDLKGAVHPSHESMARLVDFTVGEARSYALLEIPLLSGGEVRNKGETRPRLERKLEDGRWSQTWQDVDVLDDRVVFYFDYLAPGEYRATVSMTPEIAGFHNMLPARLFLMYFPHVEGTSESHRVTIGRQDD